MDEIKLVKSQFEKTVTGIQVNVLRYYDVLHELRRLSLILFRETDKNEKRVEKWFGERKFGVCPDGFWQCLPDLKKFRDGSLPDDSISYSCHPDLKDERDIRFKIYSHRNIGIYLKDIRKRLAGSAWLYYQDAANFAFQYPFIDQITAITPDFDWKTYHTWKSVSPENNPDRSIQWTSPSIDYAGEGLIISVSIPVYDGERFEGLWSIDLPMDNIYRDYIDQTHLEQQQNFITDFDAYLIVHPSIETEIDKEKGSFYRKKTDVLGFDTDLINFKTLIQECCGKFDTVLSDQRNYDVLYRIIPELKWVFFTIYPTDIIIDVINNKIKKALDKVKHGNLGYRLENVPESVRGIEIVRSFNEMSEALEAQQIQLEKSREKVLQSEKLSAIGNLAGGIAHDFNNMLSVILGYGEELLHAMEHGNILRDFVTEIIDAAKRSADLTRQLLAFSRKQTMKIEVVDLNVIVKKMEKMLRRLIGEDINMVSDFSEEELNINVDPAQIEQVILNLAVNARDSMQGGGTLTIETCPVTLDEQYGKNHVSSVPGDYAMISISDNGSGMDRETKSKIFEPFFTTKKSGEGTGLGLSTVYGIVKQSGGNIWVYSEKGQGTTFKIYFPRSRDQKVEIKEDNSFGVISGSGEKILVVEDEKSMLALCERFLKSLNYKVFTAENGVEALDMVKSRNINPDMVVTDVVMPEMNGKELVENLKKEIPEVKVLFMSGYTENAIVHHGVLDTGTAFIQKPFTRNTFGEAVKKILAG